ncbi:hypothetical protein L596_019404 [Steinernema carpocapsae]|uniref:Uncharacterized protein n=1 Tax=Steinernema carpocapsae TaxID=34508 RepID=A0A4U5MQI0_STECR|nr:hypothetical protein L596_019404 [Steinernema carpocapsae]
MIRQIASDLNMRYYQSVGFEGSERLQPREKTKTCGHASPKHAAEKVAWQKNAYKVEQEQTAEEVRRVIAELDAGNEAPFEKSGIAKEELVQRMKNWIERNEKEIDEATLEQQRLKTGIVDTAQKMEKLKKSIAISEQLLKNMSNQ